MFPFLLGKQDYITDASAKASWSQAHKKKWSVPLDVNGSSGAGIRTQDLPRAGRTPSPLGHRNGTKILYGIGEQNYCLLVCWNLNYVNFCLM